MDWWARLIGGGGSTSSSKPSPSRTPEQRLVRFKKFHAQLLAWHKNTASAANAPPADTIRVALQHLTSILHEETRTPAPHPCLAFASSSQIYSVISKIASRSQDEGVIREAIAVFGTFIDSEEEDFLGNEAFVNSLMVFVGKIAGVNAIGTGSETEGDVVELLFGVAAKIRLQPEILPVWFTCQDKVRHDGPLGDADGPASDTSAFAGVTHKEDFPLFYLLIDYVHHEGRVGDFARTGLLYIIESASISSELEQWIVESDLATLMASGLGALYSQLSRKLVLAVPTSEMPAVLALSDCPSPPQLPAAEISSSVEHQTHLDTFLSYLAFWQDVLEHCKSMEVKQTLLDHFQILFLQQLLYPSLLESSDMDGGSSVAVLTYLRRILDSLDHPDLIDLILQYLLALPKISSSRISSVPSSPIAKKRRETLDTLSKATDGEDQPTPDLFSLVDLILTSLRSRSQATVTATLRLVSVVLQRHHQYALSTLLHTVPVSKLSSARTIGAHDKDLDLFLSMVADINPNDSCDESYEDYIKDNLGLLESHSCSASLLSIKDNGHKRASTFNATVSGQVRDVHEHTLRLDDPLLITILYLLENFFFNDVDTNLALTEAIIELASCGMAKLEGWLLVDPTKYRFGSGASTSSVDEGSADDPDLVIDRETRDAGDTESRQLRALRVAQHQPSWDTKDCPPLMAALQSLVKQLDLYRTEVPQFDAQVYERRHAFHVSEELTEALASSPRALQQASGTSSVTISKASKVGSHDRVAQRVVSDLSSNGSSLASSPRGRSSMDSPTPAAKSRTVYARPTASSGPHSSHQDLSPSPLRHTSSPFTATSPPTFAGSTAEGLRRKITPKGDLRSHVMLGEGKGITDSSASSLRSDSPDPRAPSQAKEVTVNHLLTNVVILQEFLLELAALIQVRASLFDEIRYT
ncbi:MAG: hypothetical protein M1817_001347 [Caeruleum heppii]|nr:MAG: hypothetical protein M1817_001347 [Caeruleum heppii]